MKLIDTYNLVMFIDDNTTDIFIFTEIAKRGHLAHNYVTFNSARSALTYLKEHVNQADKLPDIIFLDINMPVMDGFDFLGEFDAFPQEVKEKCKIVMLSSSVDSNDLLKATNNPNVVEFINKPLRISGLDKIRETLVSREDLHGT